MHCLKKPGCCCDVCSEASDAHLFQKMRSKESRMDKGGRMLAEKGGYSHEPTQKPLLPLSTGDSGKTIQSLGHQTANQTLMPPSSPFSRSSAVSDALIVGNNALITSNPGSNVLSSPIVMRGPRKEIRKSTGKKNRIRARDMMFLSPGLMGTSQVNSFSSDRPIKGNGKSFNDLLSSMDPTEAYGLNVAQKLNFKNEMVHSSPQSTPKTPSREAGSAMLDHLTSSDQLVLSVKSSPHSKRKKVVPQSPPLPTHINKQQMAFPASPSTGKSTTKQADKPIPGADLPLKERLVSRNATLRRIAASELAEWVQKIAQSPVNDARLAELNQIVSITEDIPLILKLLNDSVQLISESAMQIIFTITVPDPIPAFRSAKAEILDAFAAEAVMKLINKGFFASKSSLSDLAINTVAQILQERNVTEFWEVLISTYKGLHKTKGSRSAAKLFAQIVPLLERDRVGLKQILSLLPSLISHTDANVAKQGVELAIALKSIAKQEVEQMTQDQLSKYEVESPCYLLYSCILNPSASSTQISTITTSAAPVNRFSRPSNSAPAQNPGAVASDAPPVHVRRPMGSLEPTSVATGAGSPRESNDNGRDLLEGLHLRWSEWNTKPRNGAPIDLSRVCPTISSDAAWKKCKKWNEKVSYLESITQALQEAPKVSNTLLDFTELFAVLKLAIKDSNISVVAKAIQFLEYMGIQYRKDFTSVLRQFLTSLLPRLKEKRGLVLTAMQQALLSWLNYGCISLLELTSEQQGGIKSSFWQKLGPEYKKNLLFIVHNAVQSDRITPDATALLNDRSSLRHFLALAVEGMLDVSPQVRAEGTQTARVLVLRVLGNGATDSVTAFDRAMQDPDAMAAFTPVQNSHKAVWDRFAATFPPSEDALGQAMDVEMPGPQSQSQSFPPAPAKHGATISRNPQQDAGQRPIPSQATRGEAKKKATQNISRRALRNGECFVGPNVYAFELLSEETYADGVDPASLVMEDVEASLFDSNKGIPSLTPDMLQHLSLANTDWQTKKSNLESIAQAFLEKIATLPTPDDTADFASLYSHWLVYLMQKCNNFKGFSNPSLLDALISAIAAPIKALTEMKHAEMATQMNRRVLAHIIDLLLPYLREKKVFDTLKTLFIGISRVTSPNFVIWRLISYTNTPKLPPVYFGSTLTMLQALIAAFSVARVSVLCILEHTCGQKGILNTLPIVRAPAQQLLLSLYQQLGEPLFQHVRPLSAASGVNRSKKPEAQGQGDVRGVFFISEPIHKSLRAEFDANPYNVAVAKDVFRNSLSLVSEIAPPPFVFYLDDLAATTAQPPASSAAASSHASRTHIPSSASSVQAMDVDDEIPDFSSSAPYRSQSDRAQNANVSTPRQISFVTLASVLPRQVLTQMQAATASSAAPGKPSPATNKLHRPWEQYLAVLETVSETLDSMLTKGVYLLPDTPEVIVLLAFLKQRLADVQGNVRPRTVSVLRKLFMLIQNHLTWNTHIRPMLSDMVELLGDKRDMVVLEAALALETAVVEFHSQEALLVQQRNEAASSLFAPFNAYGDASMVQISAFQPEFSNYNDFDPILKRKEYRDNSSLHLYFLEQMLYVLKHTVRAFHEKTSRALPHSRDSNPGFGVLGGKALSLQEAVELAGAPVTAPPLYIHSPLHLGRFCSLLASFAQFSIPSAQTVWESAKLEMLTWLVRHIATLVFAYLVLRENNCLLQQTLPGINGNRRLLSSDQSSHHIHMRLAPIAGNMPPAQAVQQGLETLLPLLVRSLTDKQHQVRTLASEILTLVLVIVPQARITHEVSALKPSFQRTVDETMTRSKESAALFEKHVRSIIPSNYLFFPAPVPLSPKSDEATAGSSTTSTPQNKNNLPTPLIPVAPVSNEMHARRKVQVQSPEGDMSWLHDSASRASNNDSNEGRDGSYEEKPQDLVYALPEAFEIIPETNDNKETIFGALSSRSFTALETLKSAFLLHQLPEVACRGSFLESKWYLLQNWIVAQFVNDRVLHYLFPEFPVETLCQLHTHFFKNANSAPVVPWEVTQSPSTDMFSEPSQESSSKLTEVLQWLFQRISALSLTPPIMKNGTSPSAAPHRASLNALSGLILQTTSIVLAQALDSYLALRSQNSPSLQAKQTSYANEPPSKKQMSQLPDSTLQSHPVTTIVNICLDILHTYLSHFTQNATRENAGAALPSLSLLSSILPFLLPYSTSEKTLPSLFAHILASDQATSPNPTQSTQPTPSLSRNDQILFDLFLCGAAASHYESSSTAITSLSELRPPIALVELAWSIVNHPWTRPRGVASRVGALRFLSLAVAHETRYRDGTAHRTLPALTITLLSCFLIRDQPKFQYADECASNSAAETADVRKGTARERRASASSSIPIARNQTRKDPKSEGTRGPRPLVPLVSGSVPNTGPIIPLQGTNSGNMRRSDQPSTQVGVASTLNQANNWLFSLIEPSAPLSPIREHLHDLLACLYVACGRNTDVMKRKITTGAPYLHRLIQDAQRSAAAATTSPSISSAHPRTEPSRSGPSSRGAVQPTGRTTTGAGRRPSVQDPQALISHAISSSLRMPWNSPTPAGSKGGRNEDGTLAPAEMAKEQLAIVYLLHLPFDSIFIAVEEAVDNLAKGVEQQIERFRNTQSTVKGVDGTSASVPKTPGGADSITSPEIALALLTCEKTRAYMRQQDVQQKERDASGIGNAMLDHEVDIMFQEVAKPQEGASSLSSEEQYLSRTHPFSDEDVLNAADKDVTEGNDAAELSQRVHRRLSFSAEMPHANGLAVVEPAPLKEAAEEPTLIQTQKQPEVTATSEAPSIASITGFEELETASEDSDAYAQARIALANLSTLLQACSRNLGVGRKALMTPSPDTLGASTDALSPEELETAMETMLDPILKCAHVYLLPTLAMLTDLNKRTVFQIPLGSTPEASSVLQAVNTLLQDLASVPLYTEPRLCPPNSLHPLVFCVFVLLQLLSCVMVALYTPFSMDALRLKLEEVLESFYPSISRCDPRKPIASDLPLIAFATFETFDSALLAFCALFAPESTSDLYPNPDLVQAVFRTHARPLLHFPPLDMKACYTTLTAAHVTLHPPCGSLPPSHLDTSSVLATARNMLSKTLSLIVCTGGWAKPKDQWKILETVTICGINSLSPFSEALFQSWNVHATAVHNALVTSPSNTSSPAATSSDTLPSEVQFPLLVQNASNAAVVISLVPLTRYLNTLGMLFSNLVTVLSDPDTFRHIQATSCPLYESKGFLQNTLLALLRVLDPLVPATSIPAFSLQRHIKAAVFNTPMKSRMTVAARYVSDLLARKRNIPHSNSLSSYATAMESLPPEVLKVIPVFLLESPVCREFLLQFFHSATSSAHQTANTLPNVGSQYPTSPVDLILIFLTALLHLILPRTSPDVLEATWKAQWSSRQADDKLGQKLHVPEASTSAFFLRYWGIPCIHSTPSDLSTSSLQITSDMTVALSDTSFNSTLSSANRSTRHANANATNTLTIPSSPSQSIRTSVYATVQTAPATPPQPGRKTHRPTRTPAVSSSTSSGLHSSLGQLSSAYKYREEILYKSPIEREPLRASELVQPSSYTSNIATTTAPHPPVAPAAVAVHKTSVAIAPLREQILSPPQARRRLATTARFGYNPAAVAGMDMESGLEGRSRANEDDSELAYVGTGPSAAARESQIPVLRGPSTAAEPTGMHSSAEKGTVWHSANIGPK